ncbi:MarR family winged helix-turn-helix transcriptional regulator [Vineibacter terrae]|nr:MarR family winged helix-turn-helix transcriptional regulator [Vineibacter terrae]
MLEDLADVKLFIIQARHDGVPPSTAVASSSMVAYDYARGKYDILDGRAMHGDQSGMSADTAAKRTTDLDAALRQRDLRLGFLVHDVSRMRRSAFDRLMRPLGVTRAQWWVIAHLSRQDGMMQIQLADILDVGKASLGAVIDRLDAAGLVERRPDPVDGRAKRVFMTRKSHRLLAKMQDLERAFNARILKHLGEADRDTLIRLLSLIRTELVDMQDDDTSA